MNSNFPQTEEEREHLSRKKRNQTLNLLRICIIACILESIVLAFLGYNVIKMLILSAFMSILYCILKKRNGLKESTDTDDSSIDDLTLDIPEDTDEEDNEEIDIADAFLESLRQAEEEERQ